MARKNPPHFPPWRRRPASFPLLPASSMDIHGTKLLKSCLWKHNPLPFQNQRKFECSAICILRSKEAIWPISLAGTHVPTATGGRVNFKARKSYLFLTFPAVVSLEATPKPIDGSSSCSLGEGSFRGFPVLQFVFQTLKNAMDIFMSHQKTPQKLNSLDHPGQQPRCSIKEAMWL